jgi:hypothetical protein
VYVCVCVCVCVCRWVHHGGRKIPIPDDLADLADRAGDRLSPNLGNPFHKPDDFRIDDEVRWFKEDGDIPAGTIGHVVGFKPAPPRKRLKNGKAIGPNAQTMGRIYVAWGTGKYYAMEATELLLYSGTRTVPVGADWRGKLPKQAEEGLEGEEEDNGADNDPTDDSVDPTADAPAPAAADEAKQDSGEPSAGTGRDADGQHEICWHRPIGECGEHIPGETEVVPVQMDFQTGDLVTYCGHSDLIPGDDIGTVVSFTPRLHANVMFANSNTPYDVKQKYLKLHIPTVKDDVVQVYKRLTVQHVQLAYAQNQADEDHDALLLKLQELDDKALKKWMKQHHPDAHGDKIDKDSDHDHRLSAYETGSNKKESKKGWKHRVWEMHAEEAATAKKERMDRKRAKKIAELKAQLDRVKVDYEHTTHLTAVNVHEARIKHAEAMHAQHEKYDKDHKKVLHIRTKTEKEARKQRDAEDAQKVVAEREKHAKRDDQLGMFAGSVGIAKDARPGGYAGLTDQFNSSKLILISGFNGAVENETTISDRMKQFGEIDTVIEREKTRAGNTQARGGHDDVDWALVAFYDPKDARAALHGAGALEWASGVQVSTRILGHTMQDAHFLFDAMDADGSGNLSNEEYEQALDRLDSRLSKKDIGHMLQLADANHDGTIGWQEFLAASGFGDANVETQNIARLQELEAKQTKNKKKKKKKNQKSKKQDPGEKQYENPVVAESQTKADGTDENPLFENARAFEQEGTDGKSPPFEQEDPPSSKKKRQEDPPAFMES